MDRISYTAVNPVEFLREHNEIRVRFLSGQACINVTSSTPAKDFAKQVGKIWNVVCESRDGYLYVVTPSAKRLQDIRKLVESLEEASKLATKLDIQIGGYLASACATVRKEHSRALSDYELYR